MKHTELTEELALKSNKRNQNILNPETNDYSFGRIPEGAGLLEAGDIYLKLGFAGVINQSRAGAFGARHIYEKHGSEININGFSDIPYFVNCILQDGASILLDRHRPKYIETPVVVNSPHGMVALGKKGSPQEGIYYQIISAYHRNNPTGTKVGELKKPA